MPEITFNTNRIRFTKDSRKPSFLTNLGKINSDNQAKMKPPFLIWLTKRKRQNCENVKITRPVAINSSKFLEFPNVKYGESKAEIKVSLVDRMPSARLYEAAVKVDIIDYGSGIEESHLPRLTERFYRVDSVRSRELGGTGLGLAIVKHVLTRHRGFLEIESNVNEGSRFSVYLPVLTKDQQSH